MTTATPLHLSPGPGSTSAGRAYADAQLAGVDPEVVDDAKLVLTELVTNAQLHGLAPIELRVERRGAGARVEVRDASTRSVVLPVQDDGAMTGRGLRLVAALAAAWGVDPVPDGAGKVVWAELVPQAGHDAGSPQLGGAALPDPWRDQPDEQLHTVRLGAVPTGLLLEAKRHVDGVVRELTLERAGADAPLPPEVEALIDTVTRTFVRARTGVKEQAVAAAARGDRQTELVLHLPVSSVEAGERYLEALDEVDRYARQARLLTLETPLLHRLFRRWYVCALVEQLRAHAAGEEPDEPKPFVEVLVGEVDELSGLRETAHRLDLLQRVNAALTDAHTAEGMARIVLSAAVRELDASTARVYVVQEGRLHAIGQSVALKAGTAGYDSLDLDADLPGPVVLRSGQPLVLRTVAQLVERFPVLAGVYDSERSLHVVPLEVGRHRLGVLALGFAPSSRYDEAAQTAYVRALADALAQGLERIEVADRLARLGAPPVGEPAPPGSAQVSVGGEGERRLVDLAGAAEAIAGARSVERLLEVVAEAARSVVGTHQSVATRLYGGTWQHASTHVSLSDDYAQWRSYDVVPQGLGVLNAVTRENRPLRLTADQLLEHPEYRGLRDAPGHPPMPDYLAAPLISRDGHNIGLIQLSHKQDGTDFDDADEAVAVQLALMVSAALEHVETAAELEQALDRLRAEQDVVSALHDVGRAVTSRLEHAEVVQVVTDAATSMTGAQFGAFFYNVLDERGETYSLYTISGVPREAFSRFPMPRNTDVFAPTFGGEGVVRLDDVTADPRYGHMAPHHGMPEGHLPVRSYLAVPVSLKDGEVIGGLFFGHADEGVFDEDAERLAVGIAGYASIALENGRLYDAARQVAREKEEVAAALEGPLQPPELPVIPGLHLAAVFQPLGGTGRLGGDFYDVFPIPGGRWVLALGDVAGKGPGAAAVTGLVRQTLWGAAQYAPDPLAVARSVNDALLRQHSDRFATLVLAVLTPLAGGFSVEAVWAGHPPALLLRDGAVELVSGSGMPVGLFPDPDLEPVRFLVRTGETLLLHTDGLLEREGEVLDDDVLVDLLVAQGEAPVDEALEAVAAAVDRLRPARDDVAAVALRAV